MIKNILITGAKGFVGKNLICTLEALKDGRDRTRPNLEIGEIFQYDRDTDPILLEEYCKKADFVFHLAGVNRPQNPDEFMEGNYGFSSRLLEILEKYENTCPVLLSSSTQASLEGRFSNSVYGQSKLAGEELFFEYGNKTGAPVLVYRFPNLYGKWCRPNYNSAVATFCHNLAHDLPIQVNDPSVELELLYIDDLIQECLTALEGNPHRCNLDGLQILPSPSGNYCYVPTTHRATLGEIVALLETFKKQPDSLVMPEIPQGSFEKKLYSTYLSYLPVDKFKFPLKMNIDERGSFTELLKTENAGQFSVNISKPGITKGQHWHHSKWEFFMVVSGRALIQERRIGLDENGQEYPILNFEVSGDKIEAIHMIPGYAHNIINLSDTENLVTVMWANESFDPSRPDTFFEQVEK